VTPRTVRTGAPALADSALAAYQDAFAAALLAADPADAAPSVRDLVAQPGFAVYRNTVLAGCIDALQANYPTVARLVGDEWFRAAASVHAREHLPTQPSLALYGEAFPAFLDAFPPARELPYLAAVARVDRAWSESHVAADEPTLDPARLAALPPEAMEGVRLLPAAATRWILDDEWPVRTLWTRNRTDDAPAGGDIDWRGEGVLLTRPGGAVQWTPLERGGAALLDACARGASIERAVGAALEAAPETDVTALFDTLLRAGAFTAVVPA